jgi:general secretion pathway protein M
MSGALSPMLRRALALTILGALLSGAYAALVRPPLASYMRDQQTIGELRMALSHLQTTARELPAIQARVAELHRIGLQQAGYLDGQNETLAAAALQERLKSLVLREGGQFKSAQILPVKTADKARRLTVRGQMVLGLPALQHVIYELEASTPFLFVDNLDIRAVTNSQKAGWTDGETPLDVHMDIYCFMRSAT